ncbi:hypothetical protein RIF29_00786 [Crotalaria pallida]|uniref:ENTH domain-containing protein n=1 Tax=Crotalaria pallida TaxID=3830 RepID=A0AAN9IWK8_CROPI
MPSKLRKAIGAVKDQTSISLAKVTHAANLEITILKATTHDKNPIEECYVAEIVKFVSSNKVYAAVCAQCLGKRIGKTRNWVVALKSFMIILRIFQDGDPYFPREILHTMKRGTKIFNLSSFKDDSNNSPNWDYTTFVKTFTLYLDERLDCFLTGKLQRRFTYDNWFHHEKNQRKNNNLSNEPGIKDMKPTLVLDRITYWQRLLDRVISIRPTGSAKTNRLVQISLYAIVQESFDLYRDISDGLAVVLDSFFHLPYPACVNAFNACVKSYTQFDELSTFYSFCNSIGVGRCYEYPSVKKISKELMDTLQEFLKDQHVSFSPKDCAAGSSLSPEEGSERLGSSALPERIFGSGSDFGSQCTSLEDLMSATDVTTSPRRSLEDIIYNSEQSEEDEKPSQHDDDSQSQSTPSQSSVSTKSIPNDMTLRSGSEDIVSLDDGLPEQEQSNECEKQNKNSGYGDGSKDWWELVLAETVTTAPEDKSSEFSNGFEPQQHSGPESENQYNPFLGDTGIVATHVTTNPILKSQASFNDVSYVEPTFKATTTSIICAHDPLAPTFSGQSSDFRNNDYSASRFQEHNSYEKCTSPIFSTQNINVTLKVPTEATKDPDTSVVPLTFQAPNLNHSIIGQTLSAKDCNETEFTKLKEDDPFMTWMNEQIPNVPLHDQAWLGQQQLWLEHQNKIIAKHMTT